MGGVILAGVVFFALLVVLPALGLPGVLDWFGKSTAPTAAASEAPAAAPGGGRPRQSALAPDVAAGLGVQTTAVNRPATMETLTLAAHSISTPNISLTSIRSSPAKWSK